MLSFVLLFTQIFAVKFHKQPKRDLGVCDEQFSMPLSYTWKDYLCWISNREFYLYSGVDTSTYTAYTYWAIYMGQKLQKSYSVTVSQPTDLSFEGIKMSKFNSEVAILGYIRKSNGDFRPSVLIINTNGVIKYFFYIDKKLIGGYDHELTKYLNLVDHSR